MNFLQSLNVVQSRRGIGQGPNSQIMHMRQNLPVVTERDLLAWLKELVNVACLAVVTRETHSVSHHQLAAFQVC